MSKTDFLKISLATYMPKFKILSGRDPNGMRSVGRMFAKNLARSKYGKVVKAEEEQGVNVRDNIFGTADVSVANTQKAGAISQRVASFSDLGTDELDLLISQIDEYFETEESKSASW